MLKTFNSSFISNVTSFNKSLLVKSFESDELADDEGKWERAVAMASFLTIVAVVPGFLVMYLMCLSCPKLLDSAMNKAM